MLEELEQNIQHFDKPAQNPKEIPIREEESEEEYVITSDFYDFRPPTI